MARMHCIHESGSFAPGSYVVKKAIISWKCIIALQDIPKEHKVFSFGSLSKNQIYIAPYHFFLQFL